MAKPLLRQRITKQQRALLTFLQEKERTGDVFRPIDISNATGYPLRASVLALLSRRVWHEFLEDLGDHRYYARGTRDLTIEEFARRASSKTDTKTGSSKPVVPKAEDELLLEAAMRDFQLAIELFNRPTTPNRIEAFVTHFIGAFEKLSKARLIKRDGAASIWLSGKERKSISLRVALDRLYPVDNRVRLNVQHIEDLRDEATHYMLPALDAIASRYFQSGVLNFFREFKEAAGYPPLHTNGVGLMSLVFDSPPPTRRDLVQQHGEERAKAILERIQDMEKTANEMNDASFAIPLHLSVGFVDKQTDPEHSIAGLSGMVPIVVTKTRDPKKTHPHEVNHIVAEVNKRLHMKYGDDRLRKLIPGRGDGEFNTHDFSSIASFEGWKKDSNAFHFDHGTQVIHTYSDACIDFIMEKLAKDSDYLKRAKAKEVEKRKRKTGVGKA